ncbi:IclR family transcriptional regulator [Roseomonas populi]|uniref:Helix-turn-helix domain-containing protein n=1 Tax=Roseomonas populi TaxID=3121582 RepID=A0ABT1XEQ5_9PROT|nr:IclR family transcriptional regulator C-terminal domain-containing protein [Roseomonas pecuniae]MCR0985459.1 helix-turn-helix domain-containing protein [Roseomonas pecuniae]
MNQDDEARHDPSDRGATIRAVPAVTRAIAILKLLSRSDAPLGVHGIARPLGMVPSTCLHILRALVAEEMLSFDPATKRYALAGGVVALARGMLRKDPFSNLAQPVLDRLAAEYSATAIGVEIPGLDHIVAVAIARPSHALRLQVDVGSRYPSLISATGRCIAAFGGHSWREIERRFHGLRWEDPPSLAQWRADIQATKESGFAVDEGRYITGVTVIAAPVAPRERVSHALVIVGVSEQLRRIGLTEIGTTLRAQASALSLQLEGG